MKNYSEGKGRGSKRQSLVAASDVTQWGEGWRYRLIKRCEQRSCVGVRGAETGQKCPIKQGGVNCKGNKAGGRSMALWM